MDEGDTDPHRELTIKEKAEIVIPFYLPTIAMGTLTIMAIIGSHKISSARVATMASLYSIADSAVKDYQNKVLQVVGKKNADRN